MLGVFLDRDTTDRGDIDLSALEDILPTWRYYNLTRPEDLHARIADANVIISNKVVLDEAAFAAAPNLELVCVAATGTNNVDLEAATRHGVVVCNVRAYATPSVTQLAFSMILALYSNLGLYRRAVLRGEWQQSQQFCMLDFPIHEVAGKTMGIIGYGELGQAMEKIAKAFGMEVLICQRLHGEPVPGRVELNELLPQVDVLTLHCPLSPETQNLIDEPQLALMKSNALLINTARGGIVNEVALVKALQDHQIGGAGVDVLTTEPPVNGNPLLDDYDLNLIVTPHVAWASQESRQRLIDQIADNINAYISGSAINQVN